MHYARASPLALCDAHSLATPPALSRSLALSVSRVLSHFDNAQAYATVALEHEIEIVKVSESDASDGGDASAAKAAAKSTKPARAKRVTRRSEAANVETLQHVSLWRIMRREGESGCVNVRDALPWMAVNGLLSEGMESALAIEEEEEEGEDDEMEVENCGEAGAGGAASAGAADVGAKA